MANLNPAKMSGTAIAVEGIFTIIMAFINRAGHRMSWLVAFTNGQ
ncbi:hypothetical protein [Chlorogloeopsis fritschii]|nr:hypothetical protein [Chlorogloeopsis fritschii]